MSKKEGFMMGDKAREAESQSSKRMMTAVVLAIVLAIAVIAITIWWAYSLESPGRNGPSCRGFIKFDVQMIESNWTMEVTCTDPDLNLAETTMTIYDSSGIPTGTMNNVALMYLTTSNWDTYRVQYQKVGNENIVAVGAMIVIDAVTYPDGYRYQFIAPGWGQVALGTF